MFRSTFFVSVFLSLLISQTAFCLTKDQQDKIDKAVEGRETKHELVVNMIDELTATIESNQKDADLFGQLSRLQFYHAVRESDVDARIKLYGKGIEWAEKAIAIDSKNLPGNFWKASALGRQGLDIGKMKALGSARTIEKHFQAVLDNDEKYERATAHQGIGRLYFELPGWPISFGSNKKALEHLKKAVELQPDHLGHRVYYAQVLVKMGDKAEARKQLDFYFAQPKDSRFPTEMSDYEKVAQEVKESL